MENNTDGCHKKNFKKILIILTFICAFIMLCFVGVWLYYRPLVNVYSINYIRDDNNMIVQSYSAGEKLIFPENPTKTGYKFQGWSLSNDSNVWISSETIINADLTLYAKWEEKVFNISYAGSLYKVPFDCEFDISDSSISFFDIDDNVVTINGIYREGYEFGGWALSDGNFIIENLQNVNLDKFDSYSLSLKERYVAKEAKFQIAEDKYYEISNLSHKKNILIGETLTFDVVLDESVNRSKINVISSNGVINKTKKNDVYSVQVADFTQDFEVYISNVDINEYEIVLNNGSDKQSVFAKFGEIIELPVCQKEGFDFLGYFDQNGNIYSQEFVVSEDLNLEARYRIKNYTITFPKNNGKFLIKSNDNYIGNNCIVKSYLESIEFEVILSKAYSNSNYIVYAIKGENKISPVQKNGKFVIDNINDNINIYIDNITINTYSLLIDNVDYGKVAYNSFLTIEDEGILIRDEFNQKEIRIKKLFDDDNFGGWLFANDYILTDTSIQYIAVDGVINIRGDYSKSVYVVSLCANGGYLEKDSFVFVAGEEVLLPNIARDGYVFAGWYEQLVEKNTIVDVENSIIFDGNLYENITLYAGWTK